MNTTEVPIGAGSRPVEWYRSTRRSYTTQRDMTPCVQRRASEVLFDVFKARLKRSRPSTVYCGNDARSNKIAAELIRDVAIAPMDAGPLCITRYTEPFALLIA